MTGCPMIFVDKFVSRINRYSIGIEIESGKYYLSIPVSNRMVDYEEYYVLSEEQYLQGTSNMESLIGFAQDCRNRNNDNLLFVKQGKNRGIG